MAIPNSHSELLVWKIMRDYNGRLNWQLRTGIIKSLLSYSKLLAALGAITQLLEKGSNQSKLAVFIDSEIKENDSIP